MGGSSGKSGGVTAKGGTSPSTVDWLMNPAGSAGKQFLGVQLDPISNATSSMFQSTISKDYRDAHGGYSLGDSFLADTFNPMIGGKTEQQVLQANNPAWQNYYNRQGADKWGKKKPILKNPTKGPAGSLLNEEDNGGM